MVLVWGAPPEKGDWEVTVTGEAIWGLSDAFLRVTGHTASPRPAGS